MNMQYAQAVLIHERSHRGAPAGYLSVSEVAWVRLPAELTIELARLSASVAAVR